MFTKNHRFHLISLLSLILGFSSAFGQRTITVTSSADSGNGSLRSAVLIALSDDLGEEPTEDTIVFDFGGVPTTITLSSQIIGPITDFISGPIIIDGTGENITIDGGTTPETAREQRLFQIGGEVTIENLTIQNFNHNASRRSNDDGGVFQLLPNSSLTLREVTIQNCSSARRGGVGEASEATLIIEDSIFRNNQTQQYGGVWLLSRSIVEIHESVFESNLHTDSNGLNGGGVMQAFGGTLTISETSFSQNSGESRGNVINLVSDAAATLSDCLFDSNIGNAFGVVATRDTASLIVSDSTFSNNQSASNGQGGAIYNESTLWVERCTISNNGFRGGDNQFSRLGGAISTDGDATIIDSTISGNSTSNSTVGGGGIWVRGLLTMKNSTISGNVDSAGAAISLDSDAVAIIDSCTIAFNTGSGIQMRRRLGGAEPQLTLSNTILSNNTRTNLRQQSDDGSPNGVIISDGYNLLDDASLTSTSTPTTGDQESAEAVLQALSDNGGPTLTHDLGDNSDAIDQGATDEGLDQRGFERTVASADDIGAVENQPIFNQPTFDLFTDRTVSENAGNQPFIVAGNISSNDDDQDVERFIVTTDNDALFSSLPTLTASLFGLLEFTPAQDANGVAVVTVVLEDEGSNNSLSDPQTFTITVTPVNNAPSFSTAGDVTALEDAGTVDVDSFITRFDANDPEQSLVSYTVTNDNTALFSTQPEISMDGSLRFRPVNNAFGTAEVTVFATDDGDDNNTSSIQTFTLTVESQFERPSFSINFNSRFGFEDGGEFSHTGVASNLSSNDDGQALVRFEVVPARPELFAVKPAIDLNGTLTYTPAPDAFGLCPVTITLIDAGDNNNTSAANTQLAIVINSINDAPIVTFVATNIDAESSETFSQTGFATFDPYPDDEEDMQTIIGVQTSNTKNSLFSQQPTVNLQGDLTFTVAAGVSGTATITVIATDDGDTDDPTDFNMGQNSFTITVTENLLADFRDLYDLNADSSDDFLDWSGNGIVNLLYFAFGLGDPNEANVDRSRLPELMESNAFGDYAWSYVQPIGDTGLSITPQASGDLSSFTRLSQLSSADQPVETETESLDELYERVTLHFDFVAEEDKRFYNLEIVDRATLE